MADMNKPEDDKTITENKTPANETPTTEKPTPVNEQLNLNSDTPPPDKTTEEVAAQPKENEAAQTQTVNPAPGDNVVTYDFKPKSQDLQAAEPGAQNKNVAAQEAEKGKNPQDVKTPEDKPKEEKAPDNPLEAPKRRGGRPPNPDKANNTPSRPKVETQDKGTKSNQKPKPEKPAKGKSGAGGGKTSKTAGDEKPKAAVTAEKAPETPTPPPEPKEAPRPTETEKIVYINLSELHPFKDHPFQVKQDAEMTAMVESVKDKGVTQPAIVRPREDGGYELVSGHRRHMANRWIYLARYKFL